MRNLIFSGPNKGKKMNCGNAAYDILDFSDNCYITSDLQEGNNRFEEITRLKQSSEICSLILFMEISISNREPDLPG